METRPSHSNSNSNNKIEETPWNFSGDFAQNFEEHVKKSIPFYTEGHQIITELASFFLNQKSVCYDLGVSTGKLLNILAVKYPQNKFIGIDSEKEMVKIAKNNCKKFNNIKIFCKDITKEKLNKCDLIISYYTLHFLKISEREKLLANIYNSLNPNGALILFEKVYENQGVFQEILSTMLTKFKIDHGFTAEDIISKNFRLRGVLQPLTREENQEILTSAGFSKINQIFKYFCFEGLLAIK